MQQQAMHILNDAHRQQRYTALLARGFCKTRPQCGKGPLLTGYLNCKPAVLPVKKISAKPVLIKARPG